MPTVRRLVYSCISHAVLALDLLQPSAVLCSRLFIHPVVLRHVRLLLRRFDGCISDGQTPI